MARSVLGVASRLTVTVPGQDGLAQLGESTERMKIEQSVLRRPRFCGAAFALVEQLVAVALVGVAFVSLYTSFSVGFAMVQLARENLRATQILTEKMETLRLYTMDQITNTVPTNFIPAVFSAPFYPNGQSTGLVYSGTMTISNAPVTGNYSNDLKQITYEVTWTSGNVLRRRSLSTFVARNGLQSYIY